MSTAVSGIYLILLNQVVTWPKEDYAHLWSHQGRSEEGGRSGERTAADREKPLAVHRNSAQKLLVFDSSLGALMSL